MNYTDTPQECEKVTLRLFFEALYFAFLFSYTLRLLFSLFILLFQMQNVKCDAFVENFFFYSTLQMILGDAEMISDSYYKLFLQRKIVNGVNYG